MAKKISSKDLFEQEDIFKGVRDSAKSTLVTLENLEQQLKGVAEGLKSAVSGMKIDNAKGLKEFTDATAKSNELVKESIEIAKLKAQAEQQQLKAEQELIKVEKLKSQEAERQQKIEEKKIAQTKNTTSAYQQLVIQTRDLKNQSKELGAQLLQLSKEGKQNTAEFQKLQQEYNETTQASQKLDQELKGLDKTVGDNFRNVGNYTEGMSEMKNESVNLRGKLRELMIQLQNMDESDPRFQKMSREAGELKDKIQDTSGVIKATAGNAVENLSTGFVGMAKVGVAGFQAVEGAMALFGVENENVQKSLVRMTALLNLSDALKTLGELPDKFTEIKASIGAFGAKAVGAFKQLTTAGKAFATTGIGLIVAGIAYAISKFNQLSSEQEAWKKMEENRLNQKKEMIEADKAENQQIATQTANFVNLVTQLKNTNQNTKERKTLIDQINTQYGTTLKNMSNELDFQAQLNQAVADYITFQGLKIRQQQNEAQVTKIIEKQIELSKKAKGLLGIEEDDLTTFDLGKFMQGQTAIAQDELNKIVALNGTFGQGLVDNYNQIAIEVGQLNQDLQNLGMTGVDLNGELSKYNYQVKKVGTTHKTTAKTVTTLNDALKAYYDAIERERISRITDAQEKEEQEIIMHYETLFALADKAGKGTKDLKEQQLKDLNAVDKKYKDAEKQLYIDAQTEIDNAVKKSANELADIVEGLQEENYTSKLTDTAREKRIIHAKYFELEELAKNNAEQLAIITEAKNRELALIDKKASDEKLKETQENTKKLIETTTNYFIEQSNKRISQIDKEIEASQKQYDLLKQLAENGNITAQESLAEQQRIITEANRKKELEQKRQQRIELAKSVYSTYSSKIEAGSKNALAETIRDTTLLQQFINSLPAFEKGIEDTGKNGHGVDGKGGFHAILHPHERVIPQSLNSQIGNLSNEELTKIATEYNNGNLLKHGKSDSSLEFAIMVNELKNIKDVIQNKPETNIELGQITQSAIEIVNRTRKGNTTIYNRYKVR